MSAVQNKYNDTISINKEKIKARLMVEALEMRFEKLNKGKRKAISTLPAENFKLERKIAKRANQENISIDCYEVRPKTYYENFDRPAIRNFIDNNNDTLNYHNTIMPPNGVVNFDRFAGPMFIWRDYCGVAKESLIKESTESCAPNSVVVVTFYAKSGRGAYDLPREIRDGNCNYKNNLEPYLEKRFAEKGWLCLWAHHYRTNSDMLMMAFTNTKKAYSFLNSDN